jgi:N-dimethylarginine dimethylaminohydrolase
MGPRFLMTDPGHYDICYEINPWMRPDTWRRLGTEHLARAKLASAALRRALVAEGARVEMLAGERGLPDMVFPANAAVILDGVVLPARFRHPERRGEEAPFLAAFEALVRRGVLSRIEALPPGVIQEGAGDAIWDSERELFWCGYGPRSSPDSPLAVARVFGREALPLELATAAYYHLDTCFCVLAGGDVLYHPPAFTEDALALIRDRVAPEHRIEADTAQAAAFCVNAVVLGRTLVMAEAPDALRRRLTARGYRLVEIDLSPFMLSGGGAYCMTLRLDRTSRVAALRPTALPEIRHAS